MPSNRIFVSHRAQEIVHERDRSSSNSFRRSCVGVACDRWGDLPLPLRTLRRGPRVPGVAQLFRLLSRRGADLAISNRRASRVCGHRITANRLLPDDELGDPIERPHIRPILVGTRSRNMNAHFLRRPKTVARALVVVVGAAVIFLFPSMLYASDSCHPWLQRFGCCSNHPAPL